MKPVKLILQGSSEEHIPAVLGMILSYYGKSVPWKELMELHMEDASDLVSAAHKYGLFSQGYRMEPSELYRAPLPLAAHWKFRSFVVVTAVHKETVEIHCPISGKQVLSKEEFEAGFTGVAVCFAGETEQKNRIAMELFRRICSSFPVAGIFLAVAQLTQMVCLGGMVILWKLYGEHMAASTPGDGGWLWLILFALAVLQTGISVFQWTLLRRCGVVLGSQETVRGIELLQQQKLSYLRQLSGYRKNAAAENWSLRAYSEISVLFCVLQLIYGGFCFVLLLLQDMAAAFAAVCVTSAFVPVCVFTVREQYCREKTRRRNGLLMRQETEKELAGRSEDHTWMEPFYRWLASSNSEECSCGCRSIDYVWCIYAVLLGMCVFLVGIFRIISGTMSLYTLYGCFYLIAALAIFLYAFPELLLQRIRYEDTAEDMEQQFGGESSVRRGKEPYTGTADTLTLQNASFGRMGKGEVYLRGITMQVRRGQSMAVCSVDRNARKMLAHVLSGMEHPVQGDLYLGTTSVATLTEEQVFATIMLLEKKLIDLRSTVRETMTVGWNMVTDRELADAALDAGIAQVLQRHSGGYDTPMSALSAGERILVLFASAFLRRVPFLIVDNLTANLDEETQKHLLRAFRRREIGVIFLMEDSDEMKQADLVCRIEAGQVALLERREFIAVEV